MINKRDQRIRRGKQIIQNKKRRKLRTTSRVSYFSIDNILSFVGEYERFQKILQVILFISCLPASYQVLIIYFSTIVPSWKCITGSTTCMVNYTMSPDDLSRCNMSRSEWYYTEPKTYSLVTDFDLDCSNESLLHLTTSMVFIGWGFGALFVGWLGDLYGRLRVFYPSICIIIVVGFCSTYTTNVYQVMCCQLLIGVFIPGTHMQAFVLISELVGSKHRPLAGILVYLANPVGWCILAGKAFLIKNWRILGMVCTAPYLLIFMLYKFVPESVQWLHLHGKRKQLKKIMRRIAEWNGKSLPWQFEILAEGNVSKEKTNPLDLFRTCWLASITLIQGFLWTFVATCYYGLHMAANDFDGSTYRDFALITTVEIPALILAIICCDHIGRKKATLIPSFIGSLICIIVGFIPKNGSKVRPVLGVTGVFFITISFNAIYSWTVEMYPLKIRNEGMGFLQVVSHWGTAMTPWIVKGLKRYGDWCSFFTLGAPTFLVSLVALWLKETKETVVKPTESPVTNENPDIIENQNEILAIITHQPPKEGKLELVNEGNFEIIENKGVCTSDLV